MQIPPALQLKKHKNEAKSEVKVPHSITSKKVKNTLSYSYQQATKDLTLMQDHKPYKNIRLYSAKGDISQRWYIEFSYLYPGSLTQYKRFKEYLGINKIKNYPDRIKYAKDALKYITAVLADGFNPFTAYKSPQHQPQTNKGIIYQLIYLKEHLGLHATKSQVGTYTEVFNRISLWIEAKSLHEIDIHAIDIDRAKDFKAWCLFTKDLAPKTVNNTLAHLGIFWDLALDKKMVTANIWRAVPKARLKEKPIKKTDKIRFEPITDKEMLVIFPRLKKMGEQPFINFLSFVYYAWARPVEILRLKIIDIEFERDLIRFKRTETKNGKANYVQIVPPLKAILEQMDLKKYPPDHYIFSTGYQPGIIQLSKNNPSAKWRDLVRGKLKINKDLYALKHTGNIEYLLNNRANLNLKWQQSQNRHSSAVMTEQYNRQLGAFFIDTSEMVFREF